MHTNKEDKVCFLCGTKENLTDEHIPPKNLAPKYPDKSFFIVPSCKRCNNELSHEESKFRDFIISCVGKDWGDATNRAWKNMQRNFARNAIGRAGRPHKDLARIIKNISITEYSTPRGIYLGKGYTIQPPKDLNYRSVLIKIAKGIQYHETKTIIPSNYKIKAELINEDSFQKIKDKYEVENLPTQGNTGHGFLVFHGGFPMEDKASGIWFLGFYQKVWGVVSFIQPKYAQKEIHS